MTAVLFPVGLLALVLAMCLRAPGRGGKRGGALWFFAGLAYAALFIRLGVGAMGILRPSPYDAFITQAASSDDPAPVALFLDASYSRNAIDDAHLTQRLRDMGYPHRAVNLSLEGSSLQERGQALRRYVSRAGKPPDAVFIGVSGEFDNSAASAFISGKFSERAIGQFTPEAASWSVLGLAGGACEGLVGCVRDGVLTAAHLGLNVLNVGLVSGGRYPASADPAQSFDPVVEPREALTDAAIAEGLSAGGQAEPRDGPVWASSYRDDQRRELEAMGVRRVAYYMPPVVSAPMRDYVSGLCAGELRDWPCIAADDPVLLDALSQQVWFDAEHLLATGASIYTDWLARRIREEGVLE